MRLFTRVMAVIAAGMLVLGALLPRRSEVRRTGIVAAGPEALLIALEGLPQGPTWAPWSPAQEGTLRPTARTEAGIWFDVQGSRKRKAVVQLEVIPAGTRLIWSDVEHYGFNPLAQLLAALRRDAVVGEELERSLSGLAASF